VAGRNRPIEKSNDLIGNRTRDLPACSIVPQRTTLPRVPFHGIVDEIFSARQTVLDSLYRNF
jgi:hypothetical protein